MFLDICSDDVRIWCFKIITSHTSGSLDSLMVKWQWLQFWFISFTLISLCVVKCTNWWWWWGDCFILPSFIFKNVNVYLLSSWSWVDPWLASSLALNTGSAGFPKYFLGSGLWRSRSGWCLDLWMGGSVCWVISNLQQLLVLPLAHTHTASFLRETSVQGSPFHYFPSLNFHWCTSFIWRVNWVCLLC